MHKVLLIRNTPPEGPGLIADVFDLRGIAVHEVHASGGEVIPEHFGGFSAIVFMGGPQAVYRQKHFPYLADEIALCRKAITEKLPTLGICLGGQIMAAAMGGNVQPHHTREIGWADIRLTDAAQDDPLFADLPGIHPAFHFHGDAFEAPPGSIPLASSKTTPCQAFRYGPTAYAFQYHPEVDAPLVDAMLDANVDYVREAGYDAAVIRAETQANLHAYQQAYRRLMHTWCERLT